MKRSWNHLTFVPLTALMALLMLAGCGSSPETPAALAPVPTGAVKDSTWFVQQLQARGATGTLLQTVDQTLLFAAPLRLYRINHERISVYEYANERAAQSEAAKISPGGERIGSAIVDWWVAPHFYQVGRLLVLYVGSERPTLTLLGSILGSHLPKDTASRQQRSSPLKGMSSDSDSHQSGQCSGNPKAP